MVLPKRSGFKAESRLMTALGFCCATTSLNYREEEGRSAVLKILTHHRHHLLIVRIARQFLINLVYMLSKARGKGKVKCLYKVGFS